MFDNELILQRTRARALGSHITIKNTVKVSELTNITTSKIGFTLIATSTSLPELAVAISAGISGNPGVSVGTVFGSNIANIAVILGFGLLLVSFKKS